MRRITLTFDNGPEPGITDVVLDTLAASGVRAAFFVVGSKLEREESLGCARRAAREGHRVGNHSYHHREALGLLDPDASRAEIARTQALLDGFAGERLFRPIGGDGREGALGDHLLSPAARDLLIAERFTVVLWNVVPRDWERPDAWVDVALERCRQTEHAVVVLHDLPTGAMAHLPTFIERATDEGAQFYSDFPPSCVVLERGVPGDALDAYVHPTS
ncbi:MAG: peptidoglycan-N-acetylglucosamine deacetylase [Baekduia sp.]|jgi:peptidoglycan/xylan/chitin deacetylase (PgdA/CDA1 family)|nr:peptidoglycan-N-acetylglucosamine deacetylase [Baekduia sp.]